MKKRILSLLLAAAMVFTSGVMVAGVEADAAATAGGRIIKMNGNGVMQTTSAGAAEADAMLSYLRLTTVVDDDTDTKVVNKTIWENANGAQFGVGDTIEVKLPSSDPITAASNSLAVMRGGFYNNLSVAANVSIIRFDDGDEDDYEIVGTTKYTFTREDIDNEARFGVMIWIPLGADEADVNEADDKGMATAEDVYASFTDNYNYTAATSGGGAYATSSNNDLNGHAYALVSPMSGLVGKGQAKADQFVLKSATAKTLVADGAFATTGSAAYNLVQDGNNIYMSTLVTGGAFTNASNIGRDVARTLELQFEANKEVIGSADVAAHESAKAKDSLFWQLVKQDANGKTTAPANTTFWRDGVTTSAGVAAENVNNTNVSSSTAGPGTYDVYVWVRDSGTANNRFEGDYYVTRRAVKTNYKVMIFNATPRSMVVFDMQFDKDETSDQLNPSYLNYVNADATNGNAVTTVRIGNTNKYAASINSSRPNISLPTNINTKVNTKTTETGYFQGWATTPNTKNVMQRTRETVYTSKTYYAVWDKMIKAENNSVYRLYNPKTGEHLYTGDYNEYLVQGTTGGWKQEGVSWIGISPTAATNNPQTYTSRVRRLYNKASHEHLYVQDGGNEMNHLLKNPNWVAEAVVFIPDIAGTSIYRLFNPKAANAISSHLWTTDANEMNYLRTRGWNYEGVPFFGVAQ